MRGGNIRYAEIMTGVDIKPFADFLLACLPDLAPELPLLVRQWTLSETAKSYGVTGGEIAVEGRPPSARTAFIALNRKAKSGPAWFPAENLAEYVLTNSRVKRELTAELLERMRHAWLKVPDKYRRLEVTER